MLYYRVSYPGYTQTVVRLFTTRQEAEAWIQKLCVGRVATLDLFSTMDQDTEDNQQPRG